MAHLFENLDLSQSRNRQPIFLIVQNNLLERYFDLGLSVNRTRDDTGVSRASANSPKGSFAEFAPDIVVLELAAADKSLAVRCHLCVVVPSRGLSSGSIRTELGRCQAGRRVD